MESSQRPLSSNWAIKILYKFVVNRFHHHHHNFYYYRMLSQVFHNSKFSLLWRHAFPFITKIIVGALKFNQEPNSYRGNLSNGTLKAGGGKHAHHLRGV